ncbi:class I SAM-dependent rRNA methyltransferase [Prosthecobacter sp.]|jgi:23S rRNA (cytosine1962-C5)-methyltransferase|uniref:class I SAM-dependent rRNA methyltransferase n=1 Tax=Prosthecobacter sp. TaxID=1965333 RepID=UPI003784F8E0
MPPPPRPPRRESSATAAPPPGSEHWPRPWAQMKYFSFHPAVYPNMIRAVSPDAGPGDLVHVMDKEGQLFGSGFFNPKARVPLRVLQHGEDVLTEEKLDARLDAALDLRLNTLRLDSTTDAWRAVHSDGDGLSGLVVDRYADVLSIEVTTLGIWRRLRRWLPKLHERLGTTQHVIEVDPDIARIEAMRWANVPEADDPAPRSVRIRENNVRYQVSFEDGHKTGFFCDQRDNRLKFAHLAKGRSVLDLCSYTGGFALSARVLGGCEDVTGVDLDEKAIAQAKKNADLNQVRLDWVHADTFTWGRQMQQNGKQWDTVVLDPPKLVFSRDPEEGQLGRNKYYDMNAVALGLLKRGGLFVTCSCSGLLDVAEFEDIVMRAAHRNKRRLQILDRTGAGADHPVMSNCPEGRYLKVLWCLAW